MGELKSFFHPNPELICAYSGNSGVARQNGHATLKTEESSEDVLDSLTRKMASALGSLGDDHEIDTLTKDERVNTVFGEFTSEARYSRLNDIILIQITSAACGVNYFFHGRTIT